MFLDFLGYGAEYNVGSLSTENVEQLKILMSRFDIDDILADPYDFCINVNKYNTSFYDYNDVLQEYNIDISDGMVIKIQHSETQFDIKNDAYIFAEDVERQIKFTKPGYYIVTKAYMRGKIGEVRINIDKNEFDLRKLKIKYQKLNSLTIDAKIISSVEYNDTEFHVNYDNAHTKSLTIDFDLIFVDESFNIIDGKNKLKQECNTYNKNKYNILQAKDDLYDFSNITFKMLQLIINDIIPDSKFYRIFLPILIDKFGIESFYKLINKNAFLELYNPKYHKVFEGIEPVPEKLEQFFIKNHPEWFI